LWCWRWMSRGRMRFHRAVRVGRGSTTWSRARTRGTLRAAFSPEPRANLDQDMMRETAQSDVMAPADSVPHLIAVEAALALASVTTFQSLTNRGSLSDGSARLGGGRRADVSIPYQSGQSFRRAPCWPLTPQKIRFNPLPIGAVFPTGQLPRILSERQRCFNPLAIGAVFPTYRPVGRRRSVGPGFNPLAIGAVFPTGTRWLVRPSYSVSIP